MTPDFLLQLFLAVATGMGVYGAIRADLARALLLAQQAADDAKQAADNADKAHVRMSDHVERHHTIFSGG